MELVMEQEAPAGEVCLTPEAMDAYLDTLRQQGRSADTLAAYRRSIYGLYQSLPPEPSVLTRQTLLPLPARGERSHQTAALLPL